MLQQVTAYSDFVRFISNWITPTAYLNSGCMNGSYIRLA